MYTIVITSVSNFATVEGTIVSGYFIKGAVDAVGIYAEGSIFCDL